MSPSKKSKAAKEMRQPRAAEHDVGSDSPTVDYVEKLVEAHPLLFRGKPPRVWSDLPPGWYGLVDRLCLQIEATLGDQTQRFRVAQIKEKFGGLRVYWSLRGRSRPTIDIVSERGHARVKQATGDEISARIDTLVSAAEEESARTCEQCGAPAKLRRSRSGWLSVRCSKHVHGPRSPG